MFIREEQGRWSEAIISKWNRSAGLHQAAADFTRRRLKTKWRSTISRTQHCPLDLQKSQEVPPLLKREQTTWKSNSKFTAGQHKFVTAIFDQQLLFEVSINSAAAIAWCQHEEVTVSERLQRPQNLWDLQQEGLACNSLSGSQYVPNWQAIWAKNGHGGEALQAHKNSTNENYICSKSRW